MLVARPQSSATRAALPLRDHAVDAVVAAFSLNHLEDPVAGLREAARVTRTGGALLASAYAEDDTHPAKDAAEAAAREYGWESPRVVPEHESHGGAQARNRRAGTRRARSAPA